DALPIYPIKHGALVEACLHGGREEHEDRALVELDLQVRGRRQDLEVAALDKPLVAAGEGLRDDLGSGGHLARTLIATMPTTARPAAKRIVFSLPCPFAVS